MNLLTIKYRIKELFRKKTKMEKLQAYAEKVVIKSGINLENVLVHDFGGFGLAGIQRNKNKSYTIKNHEGLDIKFEIPHPNEPYIIVPEITSLWSFSAWLHEVGHYVHKHYKVDSEIYIKEYEAETYCMKLAKKCKVLDKYDLRKIKKSASAYLTSHINLYAKYHKRDIDIRQIDKEAINFIIPKHKEYLEASFELISLQKYSKRLDEQTSMMVTADFKDRKNRERSGGMYYGG